MRLKERNGSIRTGCLAALLLIAGCSKDIDQFIPNPTLKGDIDRFYEAAREDISTKRTINIDFPVPVVTARNSVLIFQPGSLKDAHGNTVSGPVTIEVLELLTKGEILLYGIPTNSRDKLLESAGEFYIRATQNGEPLDLRDGMTVRILRDVSGTVPTERMELFYGEEEFDPITGQTLLTWIPADDGPGSWNTVNIREWQMQGDSGQVITGFGYECFSERLNWINFDVFMDIPEDEKTSVCVSLPEEYGNVNTVVFLVFNDLDAIIALPGDPETMRFCNYYTKFLQLGVPIGASVTFVVISEQGEDCYFFALVTTVIVQDHEEFITPVKTTLEEIKAALMML